MSRFYYLYLKPTSQAVITHYVDHSRITIITNKNANLYFQMSISLKYIGGNQS